MEAIQLEMTLRSFQQSMMIESFMMVFFLQHHTRTPVGPVRLELASTNRLPEKGRASYLSCLERLNLRSSTSCLVLLEPLAANGVEASAGLSTRSGREASTASRSCSTFLAGHVTAETIANSAYQATIVWSK